MSSRWSPLVVGDDGAALAKLARQIADSIAVYCKDPRSDMAAKPAECSDLALMFAYAARVLGDDKYAELAGWCREQALENAGSLGLRLELFGGLSGVAWVESLLSRAWDDDPTRVAELDEQLEDLDDLIFKSLSFSWPIYDLIGGLVGIAVSLLDRLPSKRAQQGLELIAEKFGKTAEQTPEGLRWFSAPEALPPHQREESPQGYYNLGLAHGIPGILVVLAEMHAANILPEKTEELVRGGVAWMLRQERRAEKDGGHYPSFVTPLGTAGWAAPYVRWCYFDFGVAMALLRTGRLLNERSFVERAAELLEQCARVGVETAGIVDGGLCHGAFGAAHLFNRAHQALGNPILRDAALRWYGIGKGMHTPDAKLGGFRVFRPPLPKQKPEENLWHDSAEFLEGSSGICLALLAAISAVEPKWDHRLLVTL